MKKGRSMQNRIFCGNSFLDSDRDGSQHWHRSGRQLERSKTLDFSQLVVKKASGLRLDNRFIFMPKH